MQQGHDFISIRTACYNCYLLATSTQFFNRFIFIFLLSVFCLH